MKPENKDDVTDGLYWINPDKLIYFHEKLQSVGQENKGSNIQTNDKLTYKHPERFVIFRPDFLYLIYAVLKDPEFQTDEVAPMKVSFHSNVYVPDYNNKYEEFMVTGDFEKDTVIPRGLTASDPKIQDEEYEKTPNGDQTYTYLKTIIPGLGTSLDVMGIKQDRRGSYVKLWKEGHLINKLLYQNKFEDGSYPLIINQYTAKKLEAKKGTTIVAQVTNASDRFNMLAQSLSPSKKVKFRVVDIYDSYYKPAFFVSQKHANEILGLDSEYGYNGIHTKQFNNKLDLASDLPVQLSKSISGYSPSGIYARQKINKNDNSFHTFLKSIPHNVFSSGVDMSHPLIPNNNEFLIRRQLSIPENISMDTSDLAVLMENMYGNSYSLASSIIALENASLFNDYVFGTVSDLIISIINLFITIFTPLLVFALLVITNLIIEDLKNLLTILNLLGFTYSENSVTILLYLSLVLGFSIIISLPVSSALLSVYVKGIFNALSIYLPIYLRFDYVVASLSILMFMFGFSYYISRRKIKSLYLPVAMKSLNE